MFELEHKLTLDKATIQSYNLTERFGDEDLTKLGEHVWEGFVADRDSRSRWLARNEAGMDLALQVVKAKSFPWPECANVAFPLVTIAAMQFHARAYPAIIQGTDIVKCRVSGVDPDGALRQKADRISSHMSWQCYEEDSAWEEQHDRELLNLSIVGCNFIKSYYSAEEGHNVSELVLARDFVIDYYAKNVESAARKTQIIPLHRNEIYTAVKRKRFRDILEEAWYKQPPSGNTKDGQTPQDNRQGVNPPTPDEQTPFKGLEQHVLLDLDKDGYAEPYIVTIEHDSHCVLRLVTAFDREEDIERDPKNKEVISIRRMQYYTKYSFIPSPDGGIYDIGFGVLLGPLNESVNTAINQLFDAGTMATTAGGFIGRGAKIRGGVYTFSPFGWQPVDSIGDDLRKNLVQLEVREPSAVLFNLLSLLINYTNRISGANDMMVGENPGQNTPAETTRAMVEQGQKIYNAIFKRVWRAMKEEFKKLYILNAIYLPGGTYGPSGAKISRQDYLGDPNLIAPAADPNLSSKGEQFAQAQAVKASAIQTPGYDPKAVETFYLRALGVSPEEIEMLYPGPDKMPPGEDVKLQIAKLTIEQKDRAHQATMALEAARLQQDARLMDAEVQKLQIELQMKMAELEGDVSDREVQRMNAMVSVMKSQADQMRARADVLMAQLEAMTSARQASRDEAEFQFDKRERMESVAVERRKLSQKDRELSIKQQVANKPAASAK